jgi:hypothetical protein
MIQLVSYMEEGFLEREIQGRTPWFGRSLTWRKDLYRVNSRGRSHDLFGFWQGERLYVEGNPGTHPMVWSVSDVLEGFLEREIQGPIPSFGRSIYREGNPGTNQ